MAHLSQNGYAYRTAGCHLAAISYVCKINNLKDNTHAFIIRKVLEGMKKLQNRADMRKPITFEVLQSLTKSLEFICSSEYETILFKTAFLLSFFGLLRVSEITFPKQNILIFSKFIQLRIPFSKTDQFSNGATIKIEFDSVDHNLLKESVTQYSRIRPKTEGQYFCHSNGTPLTQNQFRQMLQKALRFLGKPKTTFQTHSFRIGGATHLYKKAVPEHVIREFGRWKSSVYKRYIRL